jgi:hypothetical protein
MRGQWVGEYTGSTEGALTVNIDETEENFEGVAYLHPYDDKFPASGVHFSTKGKSLKQRIKAIVFPINPQTGFGCAWDEIKHLYGEDSSHSESAEVSIELLDGKLRLKADTDVGVEFECEMKAPKTTEESSIPGDVLSWSEFKSRIEKGSKSKLLYRGQQKPWRLSTAFHRRRRYRMNHFMEHDVKQLHRRLSAITPHYFDLSVPEENGAFVNLIQHHGYPTPLLDWSRSAYVAAFFAFRDWPINHSGNEVTRIYIFNDQAWCRDLPQWQVLGPAFSHLSVMEFIALDNPRLVPQQSVTTITNIDNIEAYVSMFESHNSQSYLKAIDIPANEREVAMRDLKFMGITAGSMFPGIDGVCEGVIENNFDS